MTLIRSAKVCVLRESYLILCSKLIYSRKVFGCSTHSTRIWLWKGGNILRSEGGPFSRCSVLSLTVFPLCIVQHLTWHLSDIDRLIAARDMTDQRQNFCYSSLASRTGHYRFLFLFDQIIHYYSWSYTLKGRASSTSHSTRWSCSSKCCKQPTVCTANGTRLTVDGTRYFLVMWAHKNLVWRFAPLLFECDGSSTFTEFRTHVSVRYLCSVHCQ